MYLLAAFIRLTKTDYTIYPIKHRVELLHFQPDPYGQRTSYRA